MAKKPDRLYRNYLKVTEQYLRGRGFRPMTRLVLMQALNIPKMHRDVFFQVIDTLVDQKVVSLKNNRIVPVEETYDSMTGVLRLHPKGFGFVIPDNPADSDQDVFIPKHLTLNGVDGDHVEVVIDQTSKSKKGPEGKIVAILQRSRTHVAGTVCQITDKGAAVYAPILGEEQLIWTKESESDLKLGDRVVMKVVKWGSDKTETEAVVSHLIGNIEDPSTDVPAAIEEFNIKYEFPGAVLEEVKEYSQIVPKETIKKREDFRHLECVTIDPDTAKDFDDAISIEKDDKGHYHLGVHIADVSHYVRLGTALDKEALERCNSTYFPGTCIPMLPGVLSENLCSLRPNVNRLTASVMMHFDEKGELLDYSIKRAVIRSRRRFTYKQALKVIQGKKQSPYEKTLHLMVELNGHLKKLRYERGSLEFSIPELVIKVDERGEPYGTEVVEYDITHQMIEEFMLKCNEVIARHLDSKGKRLPFRVHEEPSKDGMKEFSALASYFGFELPEAPTPMELQLFFDDALKTQAGRFLATSYIKRMRQAEYSPENIGHYGLGLSHYSHFTSPIRRYPDLIVHRVLFGDEETDEHLQEKSKRCSEKERVSEKAERRVRLLKKLRLLKNTKKKDRFTQYEAVITKVRSFGFYFELLDFMIEGFVHISEIGDDYYRYIEQEGILRGSDRGEKFRSGERITVMPQKIDLIYLNVEWEYVPR
ncbi:MAG: ribonuclease R [Waddliaceae bacterium]